SLQDTPISIAAFTTQDLEARGIVDFSEIGEFTPNVVFDFTSAISGGNSAAIIMIRGVGTSDWALPVDPGVGLYLDGVYIARTVGQVMDTVDVERIEVLRGPQGTLFGRNTIGGAISVVTKKPTMDEVYGRVEVAVGSYDRQDLNGYINIPFSDTFAGSASVSSRKRDGYVKNIFPGAPDLGDNDDLSGRIALRWAPSDSFTFDLSADYSTTDEAPAGNVLIDAIEDPDSPIAGFTPLNNQLSGDPQCSDLNDPGRLNNTACFNSQWAIGPFRTNSSHRSSTPELQTDERFGIAVKPESSLDVWGISGTAEWDLTENLTFKSITAHRRVEDGFWSRDSGHAGNQDIILVRTTNLYEQEQTTQEFQLLGSAFDDRLSWVAGVYYLEEEGSHLDVVELVLNSVFDSGGTIDNTSTAVFTQGTFDVTDKFSITAGLRYTDEEKEFTPNSTVGLDEGNPEFGGAGLVTGLPDCLDNPIPVPGNGACVLPNTPVNSDTSETEPYLNLSYRFTEDLMAYVSYSEGFKGGAFTQRVFPPALATPIAGPEFVEVYEAGFKSTWFDSRVRLNGAMFFNDYTDLQVNVNQETGTGGGTVIGTVTANAAAAEIFGFELEMTAVPSEASLIQIGIGYLDAEYVELDESVDQLGLDFDLVNAPEWNINIGGQYRFDLENAGNIVARVDYSYTSEVYNDSTNAEKLRQSSNSLVNAALTWTDREEQWSATLAGKNLTDETYLVTGFSGSGIVEGVYGLPQTWSVSVRRSF
ncbi:MAG: iron complex outermembrane receptor protein, partial [Halioglobus sp.]